MLPSPTPAMTSPLAPFAKAASIKSVAHVGVGVDDVDARQRRRHWRSVNSVSSCAFLARARTKSILPVLHEPLRPAIRAGERLDVRRVHLLDFARGVDRVIQ